MEIQKTTYKLKSHYTKKWATLFLALCMALSFSACEETDDGDDDGVATEDLYGSTGLQTITLDGNCDISDDFVFENSKATIDYVIDCELEIKDGANVTVEPGTVIAFKAGAGILLSDGSFKAVGTETDSIYMIGRQNVRGFWLGLFFNTNNPNNELEYVNVANGGQEQVYVPGLGSTYVGPANVALNLGQLSMKHVKVSKSGGHGFITEREEGVISGFANNTFTDNEETGVMVFANQIGALDGASDYTGNEDDVVEVLRAIVEDDQTLQKLNVPYRFEKDVEISADVTIQAGADLTFKEKAALVIQDGSLKVEGTADEMVQFRGVVAAAGYWNGLFYSTNNSDNVISYAVIADAGGGKTLVGGDTNSGYRGPANITLNSGRLGIVNSTIKNSASYGFRTDLDGAEIEAFTNNNIMANQDAGIYIAANQLGSIDGTNVFSDNKEQYIDVRDSDVTDDQVWQKLTVPARFNETSNIKANVEVEAGANMIFSSEAALVLVEGSFSAIGTSEERITFLGEVEVDGHWGGLFFNTTSPNNELSYVDVGHAGGKDIYVNGSAAGYRGDSNIYINSGQLTVSNSTIYKSRSCGISIRSGATLNQQGNEFRDNRGDDICE